MASRDENKIENGENKTPEIIGNLYLMIRFVLKKWWLFLIVGILAGDGADLCQKTAALLYKQIKFCLDDAW